MKNSPCLLQSCQGQSYRLAAGCNMLSPPLASLSWHTPLQSKASERPRASKSSGGCSAAIVNAGVHPRLARDRHGPGTIHSAAHPQLICAAGVKGILGARLPTQRLCTRVEAVAFVLPSV